LLSTELSGKARKSYECQWQPKICHSHFFVISAVIDYLIMFVTCIGRTRCIKAAAHQGMLCGPRPPWTPWYIL